MSSSSPLRAAIILPLLALLLLASIIFAAGIGAEHIPAAEILRNIWGHLSGHNIIDSGHGTIIWEIRLPRIVLAVLVGASLAIGGALMQSLFHNPMADPYIVGVSSGGAVGAVLAITFGIEIHFFGVDPTTLFAFLGGVIVTLLVYLLSRRAGRVPVATLLLTGIAVGGLLQAVTAFLILRQSQNDLRQILSWLMGSLEVASWSQVTGLLPYTIIGTLIAFALRRDLNILALGDETAHHLGINLERLKLLMIVVSALLAAAAVSVSGIIAFVGLIIPHLMRLLIGPDHRMLIPACLLSGGILLLWSDVLTRTLIPGQEIPIGIITSALGCAFFLYLLNSRKIIGNA